MANVRFEKSDDDAVDRCIPHFAGGRFVEALPRRLRQSFDRQGEECVRWSEDSRG